MLENKWSPSATWVNTMTARETNPNNNKEPPTVIAPILLSLALHRGRFRVFDLHPVRRPAPTIGRAQTFTHNALATELAGFAEDGFAVPLETLVEDETMARAAQ